MPDELIAFCNEIGCSTIVGEPMCKRTTFKIGGLAELFLIPQDKAQLVNVVNKCNELNVNFFILGGGSNLLVSDHGINGAVIYTGNLNNIELVDKHCIKAGAGVKLASLCQFALDQSLSGLEFAWGIPGRVGGAVFMNAGAYGGQISDVFQTANCCDKFGVKLKIDDTSANFAYRSSVFSKEEYIVLDSIFKLEVANITAIRERMDELMTKRLEKQPYFEPSAGSVFKRPLNNFAGTLIEECGLKGKTIGDAQVSEKHAGFIVNNGTAKCSDVKILIEEIQQEVFYKKGIKLECEIKFIG